MTASGAPQNTDSIHRIAAAPGKTDRILPADAPARSKPKLPDQLREVLRSRHYSRRTEQTYCHWVKRFMSFHNGLLPNHRMKADGGFTATGIRRSLVRIVLAIVVSLACDTAAAYAEYYANIE